MKATRKKKHRVREVLRGEHAKASRLLQFLRVLHNIGFLKTVKLSMAAFQKSRNFLREMFGPPILCESKPSVPFQLTDASSDLSHKSAHFSECIKGVISSEGIKM